MGLNIIRTDSVRAAKRQELGAACSAAIYRGTDVGEARCSLTEHHQMEILAQYAAVREGLEELAEIFYGAALPEDLAQRMASILAAAGGGSDAV